MTITEREILSRLQCDAQVIAIAAQQAGGVREYLRRAILDGHEMRVWGKVDGKLIRFGDAFAVVFKEPLHKKRGKKC